jgi:Fe-S cluster assembly ATP-binding protein
MENLLCIQNLTVSIDQKLILNQFDLEVNENEIHVIMGPNGSGKSTLSKLLAGHPSYRIEGGTIEFSKQNLIEMAPEIRSHEGLFLAFQYPIEISGVTNYDFLRIAYNEKQKYWGLKELDPIEFMQLTQIELQKLKMKMEFLNRNLNEGFSGGEKKRNEILQMLILQPKLIILDEIDSGLDVDALKIICETIAQERNAKSSLIIITHYPRILNYFQPTHVHVLIDGKIKKSGHLELVEKIEKDGYDSFSEDKRK